MAPAPAPCSADDDAGMTRLGEPVLVADMRVPDFRRSAWLRSQCRRLQLRPPRDCAWAPRLIALTGDLSCDEGPGAQVIEVMRPSLSSLHHGAAGATASRDRQVAAALKTEQRT